MSADISATAAGILSHCDIGKVGDLANAITNEFLERLNEPEINKAESIVLRVLVARAMMLTAGSWLGESINVPPEQQGVYGALVVTEIYNNPPGQLAGEVYDVRTVN